VMFCLFIFILFDQLVSQYCISDATGACNCSAVGSCCGTDQNVCSQNFNLCKAQNPLINLNKSRGCYCVVDFSNCFAKLICQPADQQTPYSNCQVLKTEFIDSGACPPSDLSCVFAPLPTLPTINCAQNQCSVCTYSSNCKWCNQNAAGLCTDIPSTCTKVNPSDTRSIVYEFSQGKCDNSVDDILDVLSLPKNPPMVVQMDPFFSQDPVLSAATTKLLGIGYFKPDANTLKITMDFTTSSPVAAADLQRFCIDFTDVAKSLFGVTDTTRVNCDPTTDITGSYTLTATITQSAPNQGARPTAPSSGGGTSLSPIAIAAIVVFSVGVVLIIIAIILLIILAVSKKGKRV